MRNFIVVLLLLFVPAAHAADKARAREAYHSASQHYNLGEFADALRDFKEAYRNFEDPTILFNIAQCQRQLGQKQDAIYAYKAYLREAPEPPNRAEVTQLIVSLETAVREEAAAKAKPPNGMIQSKEQAAGEVTATAPPPAAEPPPAATVVTPPVEKPAPLYKKWWLWTAVAGVVVVGAAVGLGVGLTRSPSYPTAQTSDGTFHF